MCDDRKRESQAEEGQVFNRARAAQAIPSWDPYHNGNVDGGAPNPVLGVNTKGPNEMNGAGSYQPAEKLSPSTPVRSKESHAREQSIVERLTYKLETQRQLPAEIRDLRRLLDLSRRVDIDAISEYLGLIQKYGL